MSNLRSYILVHSNKAASHEQMKGYLNEMIEVDTWRSDISNCFYIISKEEASALAKAIRGKTGDGRFIVTEIVANSNGWLTPESWYLVKNKKHKPKEG